MIYIFDFDRVLFDTDKLKSDLEDAGLYEKGITQRTPELLGKAQECGLDFKSYVDSNALEFINNHPGQCVIVSSAFSRNDGQNMDDQSAEFKFQMDKIKLSGLAEPGLLEKIVVTGEDKSHAFSEWKDQEAVLVDDEPEHLRAANDLGFRTVWLRKVSEGNAERLPVTIEGTVMVGSFAEFVKKETECLNKET